MKALFLVAVMAMPVMAEDVDPEKRCSEAAELASSIMEARQKGIALGKVYSAVSDDLSKRMVMAAYAKPKFGTPEFQNGAINEFRDAVHLECLRSFM